MMISFILKLMFFPVYFVYWMLTLPIRMFTYPFRRRNEERMGCLATLGWCILIGEFLGKD